MADPLDREEARQRFRGVSSGHYVPRRDITLDDAKARFREVDAGLDIAPTLHHLERGEWQPALLSIAGWLGTDFARGYLAPLLSRSLPLIFSLFGLLRGLARKKPESA